MAFKFNTGINTGFTTPMSTGYNNTFGTTTQTSKKRTSNVVTYNARYPGFDEEDYKKLERLAESKGVTGSAKTNLMDELYQYYYPQVSNSHKLNERQIDINQATYENDGREPGTTSLKLTSISQQAKQKYGIDASVPDDQLLGIIVDGTPNGQKLLENYINKGDPEFLYAAGIQNRPTQQGGTKDLINQASENNKAWDDKTFLEKADTVSNYANVVGLGTEKIDEAATKFADKWLDWGNTLSEAGTESLTKKLDNMSQKEIEAYREQYKQLLKDKNWTTATVKGDNLLEQVWNAVKGDLNYDYDDENFAKRLISQKTNFGEYLVGADDILQGESNPNVIQFFGNIPSSALKTFTATVRGMTNPYDTLKGLYTLAATEEGHQAFLDRYGSWDNFAKALNTDPVGVADDLMAIAEIVGKPVGGLMKKSGNANVTKWGDRLSSIGSANDALAQKTIGGIYGGLDKVADIADNNLVKGAVRYAEDASSIQKLTDNAGKDLKAIEESGFGQSIKNAKEEFITKLVGVDETDRDFIRNNKELVNNYLDGKKNVETVFEDVKDKINNKRAINSEIGKEYEVLRENKAKVVDTTGVTNDMKKSLADNGITIDKKTGDLKFDDLSKFNSKQRAALQDAWKELKVLEKSKKINASNVLDMRQKMDDKTNWEGKPTDLKGVSAVDKSTENLIKEMRGVIDSRAKGSVAGLKELDEKFAPAIEEMDKIRKDWLNSDGTFKDTARSKLRNLTKAGNEERLARLEKVIPGITKDLKSLDVGLTVEKAAKQGVGQYAKGIMGGGITSTLGAVAINPIAGVLAGLGAAGLWILTSPKNYVKLIESYPDIISKLEAGKKLLPADINKLQSLAARIEDGFEE